MFLQNIKYAVEEMSSNFRRSSHGGITITSGVEAMPLFAFRQLSHSSLTTISGEEEIALLKLGFKF
jgi:hypothetical protein